MDSMDLGLREKDFCIWSLGNKVFFIKMENSRFGSDVDIFSC